ncbi:MAG: PH domain-containing protein [Nocardioidaceae bacterium]|nr:PH domain-containing protein [Nocardioidaceae bacterium]MCO5324075.1 PH domain-containing protein [Nocardioidaceae bacterium]
MSEHLSGDEQAPWQRLDPLMLIVSPIHELIQFFPIVVAAVIWGASRTGEGGWAWEWIGVAIPIAIGLWRYLTTRWRITQTQVQLKRGLIGRQILVAPIDRIRSVELTATLIHRLLGLSRVRIGTGQSTGSSDGDGFVLDAMRVGQAQRLRSQLLNTAQIAPLPPDAPAPPIQDSANPAPSAPAPSSTEPGLTQVLGFDLLWARFAPLTASGLVMIGAIMALAGQILGPGLASLEESDLAAWRVPFAVVVSLGVLIAVALFIVIPVVGYLVTNWGFQLTRDDRQGSYHLRRGLFTTTETSLDRDRIRGLAQSQTVLARWARASTLRAIISGLPAGQRHPGQAPLTPLAPTRVTNAVGDEVLGYAGLFTTPLRAHGRRAARRRWSRVLITFAPVAVAAAISVWHFDLWIGLYAIPLVVIVIGAWLAVDRYRQLGHAFSNGFLVVSSGSLCHTRTVLEQDSIIGWNFRQSFFQRRLGVLTLEATIAAGSGGVAALDLVDADAAALAKAITPELLEPFLAPRVEPQR